MGRVFSIHPATPFLPALADALLDGELVPGVRYRDQPERLDEVTLYLPTRRAADAFTRLLSERAGHAVLLPAIRPLGDLETASDSIDEPGRLIGLARLIADWRRHVTASELLSPAGTPITVPDSAADALYLARDLGSLLDLATQEEVDWSRLGSVVPEEMAGWWQMTLTFLEIAVTRWPQHLAENGLSDAASERRKAALALADALRAGRATGPVIAAGSTGSVPVTARLLAAIAEAPTGAVVLPGLDLDLDDASFRSIAENDDLVGHPQATMARLLSRFGLKRDDVARLGKVDGPGRIRHLILTEALRPADSTERWPEVAARLAGDATSSTAALQGVTLIEAANEAEEALAIAVALREALEQPEAEAALVTPDRGLARRVARELARFGLAVEDSAGQPLTATPPGLLALLAADVASGGYSAEDVAALTKHHLLRLGRSRSRLIAAAAELDLKILRGPRLAPGPGPLIDRAAGTPASDLVADLVADLAAALSPLDALVEIGSAPLGAWMLALRESLSRLVAEPEGNTARPGHDMRQLDRLLQRYGDLADADLVIQSRDLPATLKALLAGESVSRSLSRSRISIWGPLEARLLSVDRLVIGGLNEGSWPPKSDSGPWLSRPMRKALGLSQPELRIGLAAHDFVEAMGCRDIVLTRSVKAEGAPTTSTRYLQRLGLLVGKAALAAMTDRGARYIDLARRLDQRPAEQLADRPEPKPPLAARPSRLSVTEIETLIRDPYAIYARHVLKLKPLRDLGELPDFATRGEVLHDALARFARSYSGPMDQRAIDALIAVGRTVFDEKLGLYPELQAMWWPRFETAAAYLITDYEAGRRIAERHAEVDGRWTLPGTLLPFTLTGRADRIDRMASGEVTIIDFKSGSAPSSKQIASLMKPQLPLEAVMLRHGAFSGQSPAPVASLDHVVLTGTSSGNEVLVYAGYFRGDTPVSLEDTIEAAGERLISLIRAYQHETKGYISRAHPLKVRQPGDYDHLARVSEWSIASEEEGESG